MKEAINSKDFAHGYDQDITAQGEQFQVDTYFEPKKSDDKLRISYVLENLKPRPGERILDIGCGVGTFAYHCAIAGAEARGLDYSENSINMAKQISHGRYKLKNVDFIQGDAMNLSFKDEEFDKIVCADFIEHINEKEKDVLLGQIRRVLKADGLAVIFTPNCIRERIGEYYWQMRHVLLKDEIPKSDYHFGLTDRKAFEPLLKKHGFEFRAQYYDITRPYFARIPLLRRYLALNLLWVIKKV